MTKPDIRDMHAATVAFVLQSEPSRTRDDARIAGEEAEEFLQESLDAMLADPTILPTTTNRRGDDRHVLDLPEAKLKLILSRPGNSYRRLELVIRWEGSRVVTCIATSQLMKTTRDHFEAALRFFLFAVRGSIDTGIGDQADDDLRAIAVHLDETTSLRHMLCAPLPWRAGSASVMTGNGQLDQLREVPAPDMPVAASLSCVHDSSGVCLEVSAMRIEVEQDLDPMEKLRLLRRASLMSSATQPVADAA